VLEAAWVAAKGLAVAAAVPCQVDAKVLGVVATAAAAMVRVAVAKAAEARARAAAAKGAAPLAVAAAVAAYLMVHQAET
jgi:hypothetical protein